MATSRARWVLILPKVAMGQGRWRQQFAEELAESMPMRANMEPIVYDAHLCLAEHYLFTHDDAWLRKVAPSMIAGCDWVFRQLAHTINNQPHSCGWERGFLPAGSLEDVTDFYYWLNVVDLLGDGSPLLIVKNEKQDRHREIDEHSLKGQFDCLKEVLATNLADNRGLEEVKQEIEHYIRKLPHVGSPLPKTWVRVREPLYRDDIQVVDATRPKGAPESMMTAPGDRYGLAFVFRVFDRVSNALVMQASKPVRARDLVQAP